MRLTLDGESGPPVMRFAVAAGGALCEKALQTDGRERFQLLLPEAGHEVIADDPAVAFRRLGLAHGDDVERKPGIEPALVFHIIPPNKKR